MSARLDEGLRESEVLLARTVEQLRMLLAVHRNDGAVARFLLENADSVQTAFESPLDALLKPFIQIPFHAVQPRVWDVLHLGAFQLAFLTHVPKHAAVNESVGLAAHVGSPKATG